TAPDPAASQPVYAQPTRVALGVWQHFGGVADGYAPELRAAKVREKVDEGDNGKQSDEHEGNHAHHEREDDDEQGHHLRRGHDPQDLTTRIPVDALAQRHVQEQDERGDHDHRPPRDVAANGDDDSLENGEPEREAQATPPQPG